MSFLRRMINMTTKNATANERRDALRKAEAEITRAKDAKIAEFNKAITEANEAASHEIEEVKAKHERREAEIDAAIAADVRATIVPLAAKFGDAPRATAAKIGAAWKELAERSERELGGPLSSDHMIYAFLEVRGLLERAVDLSQLGDVVLSAAGDFCRLSTQGAPAPALDDALRKLEARATERVAQLGVGTPQAIAAIEIRRSHAGSGARRERALERHRRESLEAHRASPEGQAEANERAELAKRLREETPHTSKPKAKVGVPEEDRKVFRQFE